MVLVLLVLMWVVVLTPSLLRSRSRRQGDSIGSFRRQLGVIQRTAPVVIPAANRRLVEPAPAAGLLRDVVSARAGAGGVARGLRQAGGVAGGLRQAGGVGGAGPGRPVAPVRPSLRAVGRTDHADRGWPDGPAAAGPSREARARTLQRRRQVLVGLAATVGLTLVLGVVPALRMLWALTAISAVLLAGYVALLVRMRNLAAEKEMKLRFLPRASDPPLLLRRSAN